MPFLKHRSPSLSQSWSATTASALSCYVATISRRHYIAMGDLFIEFYRRIGNQDKHYLYIVFKISPPHSTISLAQECLGAPMLFLADGLCNAFPAWARVSSSCVFPGADLFHHSLWHPFTWKHFPKRPLPFIYHELWPLSQYAHFPMPISRPGWRIDGEHIICSMAYHERPTFGLLYHDVI